MSLNNTDISTVENDMNLEKVSNAYKSKLRTIKNYITYELGLTTENYGERIILASISKRDNKDFLEIALKTNKDASTTYNLIAMFIENGSNLEIHRKLEQLIECGYIDENSFLAIEAMESSGQFNHGEVDILETK
jgi:hypothetical protein